MEYEESTPVKRNVRVSWILYSVLESSVFRIICSTLISDSKSCLSGLNWPRSEKIDTFWHFWLVEGTLGIGWK